MHPDGLMESSQSLNEDQTVDAKQHFFFTHDVTKFRRFIFDWKDAT